MVVPSSREQELAEFVASATSALSIQGIGSHNAFRILTADRPFSLRSHSGLVEHSPDDMVAVARAGTTLAELQEEIGKKGQCLPFIIPDGFPNGTLGGAIAMALPHILEGQFGSWRDWVLGLKLLLADGTVAKCGSKAVKNVAGYDIQKLIVGSRGSLGVILEVSLRTMPAAVISKTPSSLVEGTAGTLTHVQRTLRSNFVNAVEASKAILLFGCSETGTLWLSNEPMCRFDGDWVISKATGIGDSLKERHMKRAKAIFDPASKLNPCEWGFM